MAEAEEAARVRAMLLDEVDYHATWRHEPIMRRLHARLGQLPPQHPLWVRYTAIWRRMDELDGLALGEAQRALLQTYGAASHPGGEAEAFLSALIERLELAIGVCLSSPPTRPQ